MIIHENGNRLFKSRRKISHCFFWSNAKLDLCSCVWGVRSGGRDRRFSKTQQAYFNKTSYCSKKCLTRKVSFKRNHSKE